MDPPPWKDSEAKKLLLEDLLSGEVDDRMSPQEVFMTRAEYSLYTYTNFVSNLRNLRTSLRKQKECALRNKKLPYWPDSEACRWLQQDITFGAVQAMSKRELWLSREAYQAFTLRCFSDHIRQSICLSKERAYWSFKIAKNISNLI